MMTMGTATGPGAEDGAPDKGPQTTGSQGGQMATPTHTLPKHLQDQVDQASTDKAIEEARKEKLANDKAEQEVEKTKFDNEVAKAKGLIPDFTTVTGDTLSVPTDNTLFAITGAYTALNKAAATIGDGLGSVFDGRSRILVTSNEDLPTNCAAYLDVDSGIRSLAGSADVALRAVSPIPEDDQGLRLIAESLPLLTAAASAIPGVLNLLSVRRSITIRPIEQDDLAALASTIAALQATSDKGAQFVADNFRPIPRGNIYVRAHDLSNKRDRLIAHQNLVAIRLAGNKAAAVEKEETLKALEKELKGLEENDPKRQEIEDKSESYAAQLRRLKVHEAALTAQNTLIDAVAPAIATYLSALRAVASGAARSLLATAAMYEELYPPAAGEVFDAADFEGEDPVTTTSTAIHLADGDPRADAGDSGADHSPGRQESTGPVGGENITNGTQNDPDTSPPKTTRTQDSKTSKEPPGFTHALLVKAYGGQTQQLISDRPLWWDDRFSSVSEVAISHILIELPSGSMIHSGTSVGTHELAGTVGTRVTPMEQPRAPSVSVTAT